MEIPWDMKPGPLVCSIAQNTIPSIAKSIYAYKYRADQCRMNVLYENVIH